MTETLDRAKTLDKVRKLLAKAASTGYGEEAKAFEQKAEELMMQYRIAEYELMQGDPRNMKYQPESRDWRASFAEAGEFSQYARILLIYVAEHCGCIPVGFVNGWEYRFYGYPADLDFVDAIFTGLLLHLVNTIQPKYDPNISLGENVANFKDAGYKWERIFEMCFPGERWDRRHGSRVLGPYKKFIAANPDREWNKTTSLEAYRTQFMQAYTGRIAQRLQQIKKAADTGQGLVLVGRESDLKEAFYNVYPERRPHAPECQCSTCKPPRSNSIVRTRGSGTYRGPAYNPAAYRAGNRAANSADLGQTRIEG